ncbi:PAS domain-containing sensor histidine kinase [Parapedobacter sp. ISTM3]|uniref:PAS domain-containing sensor histidine kinase n=1 Tax=Parapedobacter sp. ISTM3 TaxID=2800130 RepID=UPI0019079A71|nr:PAS domain-containing sensor histidine kinase [Parapedobacter sp. ISTM3]MBK1439245.1 PAS domain-containing sensor histidine kinase [Parapedobacter sp. ISTM3]
MGTNDANNSVWQTFETMESRQAFLSAIIESSDDAIISKDLKGIITSWNRGAEGIFGYREAEVIGKPITILIPKERRKEEDHILRQIRKGKKVDHFQTIRVNKASTRIPISLTISPIKDGEGRIIGASKIARDISVEVNARHQANQLLNELRAAIAHKDKFIALASHELKTPLTSIYGYLQIIAKKTQEPITQKFISKATDQVEKLETLVGQLLDVVRIGADKLLLNKEMFGLGRLVADTINVCTYTFPSHTFHLESLESEVYIYADKQRIEQVLINLLSNAVKYSPFSDMVHIRLHRSPSSVTLSVLDSGIGLTADQQLKLFTRFYRAEGVEKIQGLGLGLYLCKAIIERHGGQIGVKSEPGSYTEFYFTLPLAHVSNS